MSWWRPAGTGARLPGFPGAMPARHDGGLPDPGRRDRSLVGRPDRLEDRLHRARPASARRTRPSDRSDLEPGSPPQRRPAGRGRDLRRRVRRRGGGVRGPAGTRSARPARALDGRRGSRCWISSCWSGIEVASSPIPDINALGPTVIAADFGNNNGLLLGPELADAGRCRAGVPHRRGAGGRGDGGEAAGRPPPRSGHSPQPADPARTRRTGGDAVRHRRHHRHPPIRPGQHCRVEVRYRSSTDQEPSLELRTVDLGQPS